MKILDSKAEISNIDQQNILGSVEALPKQCLQAWEDAIIIHVPSDYSNIKNVVMCGMGGSGLGARIIESVYAENLTIPLVRVNDYELPGFTDHHTLVICSSYSGNTEETLNNAKQAIAKKAKWMAIGTGGTLIEIAREQKVPYYQINATHNPSKQPRMAIGYSVVGQLVLAAKAGLFNFSEKDLDKMIKAMNNIRIKNQVIVNSNINQAKKLAVKLKGKNIFYVSARHLVGAIHTVNNQLNENAKTFSADFQIPELNHHLMEGLKHPQTNVNSLFIFFVGSKLYPERIQKRFSITVDVVNKNKINYYFFQTESATKLSQAFELIQFGGYVNLYLSVLYGQNPTPIPWVDYFKNKLVQPQVK